MPYRDSPAHCIYIHRNLFNGKVYIGQALGNPRSRWLKGEGYKRNPLFYSDILKYGWDSFSHEILYAGLMPDQADYLERVEIRRWKSTDPKFGYNRSEGRTGESRRQANRYCSLEIMCSNLTDCVCSLEGHLSDILQDLESYQSELQELRQSVLQLSSEVNAASGDSQLPSVRSAQAQELERKVNHL